MRLPHPPPPPPPHRRLLDSRNAKSVQRPVEALWDGRDNEKCDWDECVGGMTNISLCDSLTESSFN